MKKEAAILVVSFGTTHLDTLDKCIAQTERAIENVLDGHRVYRAFTSKTVIRRLEEKHGIRVNGVSDALAHIKADGFERIAVQPTLVMSGIEYDLLCREVERAAIDAVVGRPLIEDDRDANEIAGIIMEENPLSEGEALVLMGHGTEHRANWIYEKMQSIFCSAAYPAFVGTVEGTPTFEDAVDALKNSGAKKAWLLPLMFVAGDHAKNDMAGDGKNSLLSLVHTANIEAKPILRGLGESEAVRRIYVARTMEALARAEER